jgi:hypothetical protein
MKIGIISDTHDNIPNIEKAINWLNEEEIKTLLHCGDISTEETVKETAQKFHGKILAVIGNMDENKIAKISQLSKKSAIADFLDSSKTSGFKILGEIGELEIEEKRIAFCHMPEKAKELAKSGKYDIVFYGHTHMPWEEKIGDCRVVNPGNLAGIIYKATLAVYDTESDRLELKILEKLI